jgi:hypothetical protein
MTAPASAPSGAIDYPYTSRTLTRRELQKLDIHTFNSPKEDTRMVRVVGLPNLALALRLEFDPTIIAYTERPRLLRCGADVYEFSYWYLERGGRETLALLVPTPDSAPAEGGRRRHRRAEQLLDAARAAHLPLSFVFESELVAQGQELATFLRMLPSVQIARRLANRYPLREHILRIVTQFDRCRLSQLVSALEGYAPADVQCVTCDLAHAGLLAFDAKAPLNSHSLFWGAQP